MCIGAKRRNDIWYATGGASATRKSPAAGSCAMTRTRQAWLPPAQPTAAPLSRLCNYTAVVKVQGM